MSGYRVLYAYGSGDHLTQIQQQMEETDSIGEYASFRFPNCATIPLFLIPIDLNSLDSAKKFHNICGAVRQDLTIFTGLGSVPDDLFLEGPNVHLCSQIRWSEFIREDDGSVFPTADDLEEIGKSKRAGIEEYANSSEWRDWYRGLQHNENPAHCWTEALLIPKELLQRVPRMLREWPGVGVVDLRPAAYPDLKLFQEWSATALFSPTRRWAAEETEGDHDHELSATAAIDAVLALTNYIAFKDAEAIACGPTAPSGGSSHRAGGDVCGEIVFSGDNAKRRVKELRFIGKHLPHASIRIMRIERGSVRLEVEMSRTDATVLRALIKSGIYRHLAHDVSGLRPGHVEIESYPSAISTSGQPLFILDFADEIESIGGSGDLERLEQFEDRWTRNPLLAPLAKLVANSKSLSSEFSRCG